MIDPFGHIFPVGSEYSYFADYGLHPALMTGLITKRKIKPNGNPDYKIVYLEKNKVFNATGYVKKFTFVDEEEIDNFLSDQRNFFLPDKRQFLEAVFECCFLLEIQDKTIDCGPVKPGINNPGDVAKNVDVWPLNNRKEIFEKVSFAKTIYYAAFGVGEEMVCINNYETIATGE